MAVQPINIVGIAGSLRQGSYNRGLFGQHRSLRHQA